MTAPPGGRAGRRARRRGEGAGVLPATRVRGCPAARRTPVRHGPPWGRARSLLRRRRRGEPRSPSRRPPSGASERRKSARRPGGRGAAAGGADSLPSAAPSWPLWAPPGPAQPGPGLARGPCTAQDWATKERRWGLTDGRAVLRFVKLSVAFLTFQGENNICCGVNAKNVHLFI